jgi:23S rRNA (adenosine1067-2'-O)-methyltransferase
MSHLTLLEQSSSAVTDSLAVVDSLLHPRAVVIRALLENPKESGLILIDDEENILQALRAGVEIEEVFYAGEGSLSQSLRGALPSHVPIYEVARRTCKKLFENDKVSRVFAIAKIPKNFKLNDLAGLEGDIVVLENLGIAGNVGAIIRTAVAFGVGAVVLLNASHTSVYDRRVIRSSRGHVFSLPVLKATPDELLTFCEHHDVSLLVTAPHAPHEIHQAALPHRLAIVFGNEKDGCSKELRRAAKFQVNIPTTALVESLNVSAAASITLYQRYQSVKLKALGASLPLL